MSLVSGIMEKLHHDTQEDSRDFWVSSESRQQERETSRPPCPCLEFKHTLRRQARSSLQAERFTQKLVSGPEEARREKLTETNSEWLGKGTSNPSPDAIPKEKKKTFGVNQKSQNT